MQNDARTTRLKINKRARSNGNNFNFLLVLLEFHFSYFQRRKWNKKIESNGCIDCCNQIFSNSRFFNFSCSLKLRKTKSNYHRTLFKERNLELCDSIYLEFVNPVNSFSFTYFYCHFLFSEFVLHFLIYFFIFLGHIRLCHMHKRNEF